MTSCSSTFRLRHPSHPSGSALLGHDHALGFFVEVHRLGDPTDQTEYDSLSPGYDRKRPLWGALMFLAGWKFFTASELQEALMLLEEGHCAASDKVTLAMEAISALKRAGDH